jgi:hypothetical protein
MSLIMMQKTVFLIILFLLAFLITSCSCISSKPSTVMSGEEINNREIGDRESTEEIMLPDSCISDSDCPTGFSCWNEPPRGPLPGILGSKEKPGKCYRKEAVEKIY